MFHALSPTGLAWSSPPPALAGVRSRVTQTRSAAGTKYSSGILKNSDEFVKKYSHRKLLQLFQKPLAYK